MSTKKKIMIGIAAFILLFLILPTKKEDKDLAPEKDKLTEMPFDSLTLQQKKEICERLVISNKETYQRQRAELCLMVTTAFEQSVKFPNTLEYIPRIGWTKYFTILDTNTFIDDAEKGKMYIVEMYRAENNLGQKVQHEFRIDFTYDGKKTMITNADIKYE